MNTIDFLTTAKNLVTAVNQLGQTYLSVMGNKRSAIIAPTVATLVTAGTGRIVNVSVMGASITTIGTIYDCSTISTLTNPIGTIKMSADVYNWNIPFVNGLVVVPGAGMTVVVSYSGGT